MHKPLSLAALACLASSAALADTSLHLVTTAGLSRGGDTLAKVVYSNGDSEKLSAGSLLYFGLGPSLEFANSPLSLQLLLGMHIDDVTATNGSMSFRRNTLDAQAFYRLGDHRLGIGLVQHMSPTYKMKFDGLGQESGKFDDAQGMSVEYNWLPADSRFGVSLRLVRIDYELKSVDGVPVSAEPISGNHVAVGLYGYF